MKDSRIHIGISGWTYPDWRNNFYPNKLPVKDELRFASRTFNSIEVNGTFYALQKPHTFEKWYQDTPTGFTFAIKAPKYITHERRLKDVGTPVANFFASGIFALKEKLGPILWQLPPHLPFERSRLKMFLDLLPRNTHDASLLAQGHSEWMAERRLLDIDQSRPLQHAIEVRHQSFATPEFVELMKEHQVAIVIGDTAGRWPLIQEITSSLVYIRLHGDETIYPEGYTEKALQLWAEKLREFAAQAPYVFSFCDNDHKTAAPANAQQLMKIMKVAWQPDADMPSAPISIAKPIKAAKKIKLVKTNKTAKTTKTGKSKATKTKASKTAANNGTVRKASGKSGSKNKPLNRSRKSA